MARWLVERENNTFEDVGADTVSFEGSSVIFYSYDEASDSDDPWGPKLKLEIAYAAGQWLSVVPAAE